MSTKIFVMTHKKFQEPKDNIYIPLHVGKAGAEAIGYLGDDTSDSISNLNCYYGELTGVYWIWKNYKMPDYVGICHYRRYFLNKERKLLQESDYEKILNKYDIIVSNKAFAEGSYLEYFGEAHNKNDLVLTGEVLKEKYPEYVSFFKQAVEGNEYYFGNLLVTSKKLFKEYTKWLFDILFEVEKRIDVRSYDLYNQRVFGFLSEQLLKVWIDKNNLSIYEGIVGITAEKAETVEFKLAVSQLLKLGQIEEARSFFYDFMKVRPDIRLELSDLKGEIPIIEHILYICDEEKKRQVIGMYAYSSDLNQLIKLYHNIMALFKKCAQEKIDHTDLDYILKHNISWIAVTVILINIMDSSLDRKKIKDGMYQAFKQIGKTTDAGMLQNTNL